MIILFSLIIDKAASKGQNAPSQNGYFLNDVFSEGNDQELIYLYEGKFKRWFSLLNIISGNSTILKGGPTFPGS